MLVLGKALDLVKCNASLHVFLHKSLFKSIVEKYCNCINSPILSDFTDVKTKVAKH